MHLCTTKRHFHNLEVCRLCNDTPLVNRTCAGGLESDQYSKYLFLFSTFLTCSHSPIVTERSGVSSLAELSQLGYSRWYLKLMKSSAA